MAQQYVCTTCGYVGNIKIITKGSLLIEIVLWLFLIFPGLIYSIWRQTTKYNACPKCKNPSMIPSDSPKGQNIISENKVSNLDDRKCLTCNYEGQMKTWLRNYTAPQLITLVLFVLYFVPGLIFVWWFYGKYKCPSCGTIGKNILVQV